MLSQSWEVLHHAVSLVNHEVAEVAQVEVGTLADGVGQSAGRGHAAPHQPRPAPTAGQLLHPQVGAGGECEEHGGHLRGQLLCRQLTHYWQHEGERLVSLQRVERGEGGLMVLVPRHGPGWGHAGRHDRPGAAHLQ